MNNVTIPLPSAHSGASRHDGLTIALHWLTALLVVTQFLLAELWGFFPRPTHHLMVQLHMSFGVTLAAVLGLRLAWRLRPNLTSFNHGGDFLDTAARLTHRLLYVLLVAEIALGFMTGWTRNHPIDFFSMLIPSPFGSFSRTAGYYVDQVHDITAWVIMALAGVHAAAALLHHYVLKDDVLRRILPLR
ncbi:cytochrome b [Acidocella sp.]|uniref:cytochrome b n=1 Tax=Acidocella sp. TaxID=50710 RepID=UPI002606D12A|nr:cytochrome b/b6 domain-containing protein [Acidocella sp.]